MSINLEDGEKENSACMHFFAKMMEVLTKIWKGLSSWGIVSPVHFLSECISMCYVQLTFSQVFICYFIDAV